MKAILYLDREKEKHPSFFLNIYKHLFINFIKYSVNSIYFLSRKILLKTQNSSNK